VDKSPSQLAKLSTFIHIVIHMLVSKILLGIQLFFGL